MTIFEKHSILDIWHSSEYASEWLTFQTDSIHWFTPCKAEQPQQGTELQERGTKRLKDTGDLLRKNPQSIGVF